MDLWISQHVVVHCNYASNATKVPSNYGLYYMDTQGVLSNNGLLYQKSGVQLLKVHGYFYLGYTISLLERLPGAQK